MVVLTETRIGEDRQLLITRLGTVVIVDKVAVTDILAIIIKEVVVSLGQEEEDNLHCPQKDPRRRKEPLKLLASVERCVPQRKDCCKVNWIGASIIIINIIFEQV